MRNHNYYVYILTRERNSVFYVGVTNDLIRRVGGKRPIIPPYNKQLQARLVNKLW